MAAKARVRLRAVGLTACWAAAAVTPVVVGAALVMTPEPTWDDLGHWMVGLLFAVWPLLAAYGVQVGRPRFILVGLLVYTLLSFALIDSLGRAHGAYGLPLLLLGVFAGLASEEPRPDGPTFA